VTVKVVDLCVVVWYYSILMSILTEKT